MFRYVYTTLSHTTTHQVRGFNGSSCHRCPANHREVTLLMDHAGTNCTNVLSEERFHHLPLYARIMAGV